MSELLIRTKDKHPIVSALNEVASQRGDVIAICPDGWVWSAAERENPDWMIVKVSGLRDEDVAALTEPGREGEPRWRRRVGIRIDGLAAGAVLTRRELFERAF